MKKKVSLFLAIILSFFGMMSVEAKTATVTSIDAKAYYVDYGYADKGATLNTRKITLTDSESGTHSALCVAPNKKAPDVGDTSSDVVEINNNLLLKVLYYGEFGFSTHNYAADVYWKSHNTNLINGQMILTHVAASKAYAAYAGNNAFDWSYQANSKLISDTDAYINIVNELKTPSNYKVYAVKPSDNQKQVYVYLEKQETPEVPNGSLNLVKRSTETTDKSLAGAVYKVYSDSNLTSEVGSLTTDANGNTNTLSLAAGTYYIKEVTAPAGFKLNTEVYTANITAGNTYTVHATDTPEEEVIPKKTKLLVQKSGDGGEGTTLEGAEFTVYSDKELKNVIAVLITDEGGLTNYIEVDPGTYYIKETKAPKGYKLDETVHEVVVTDETIKSVNIKDELIPVVPDEPVQPDLPENPPTGVSDYLLASGGAVSLSGLALYVIKKKRYRLGI